MSPAPLSIEAAAQAIIAGKVVAYPTEAVWGLGCDPQNKHAVEKILALKQRKAAQGLILVAANIAQLNPYLSAQLTEQQRQQLLSSERPTTWLVPFNQQTTPPWIAGEHNLLAVRISRHPVVEKLCMLADRAIVSTSANPHGLPAALSIDQVQGYFADNVLVCQGQCGEATRPSTIKNLLTGEILRE